MAAEIGTVSSSDAVTRSGFNEAAANGRGNLAGLRKVPSSVDAASMRPRRMAAEIIFGHAPSYRHFAASMRPRRMAAEIGRCGANPAPPPRLQ